MLLKWNNPCIQRPAEQDAPEVEHLKDTGMAADIHD